MDVICKEISSSTLLRAELLKIKNEFYILVEATSDLPRFLITLNKYGELAGATLYAPVNTSILNKYCTLDFSNCLQEVLKSEVIMTGDVVTATKQFSKSLMLAMDLFDKVVSNVSMLRVKRPFFA